MSIETPLLEIPVTATPPMLRWSAPGLVAIATVLAFLPALRNDWVQWDDGVAFLTNPNFRGLGIEHLTWMWTTFDAAMYRPLAWMTYGADFLVWGMNPFGYHLTNLVIHTVNALLVYYVAISLLARSVPEANGSHTLLAAAAFAALLFAVHPLRVEPAAWISGRADLLSATFAFLAALAYLRHCRTATSWNSRWTVAAVALYAMSLLSKPMTLAFPLVLLVLDAYPLRRLGTPAIGWFTTAARGVWLEKLPFLLVAVAIAPAVYLAKAGTIASVTGSRLLLGTVVTLYGLAFHLWKTLAPFNLSPLYELPYRVVATSWPFLLSAAVVALVTFVLVRSRARWPAPLAAWAVYLLMLGPASGFIPYGAQMAADRYTYVACVGWAIVAAGGLLALWRSAASGQITPQARWALPLAGVAAVIVLAVLTWQQTAVWRNTEALWSYTVAVQPSSSFAHSNLAHFFVERGDVAGAEPHFRRAVEIDPGNPDGHMNLAAVLFALDRPDDARASVQALLASAPDRAVAYRNLANTLFAYGRLDEASVQFEQALALSPSDAEAENGLGVVRVRQAKSEDAKTHFTRALQLRPKYADAHNNLANVLLGEGKFAEAVIAYQAAVKGEPRSAEARVNLGDALMASRNLDAAVEEYRRAIGIEPRHARAHNNLGFALMTQGKLPEAIRHLQLAVEIAPDFPGARQNLDAAIAQRNR